MANTTNYSFTDLLERAVTEPGRISSAYHQFHGYSLGNQLLALWQCEARGLEPGPIATYRKWRELGRQVRKGEKALTLCMPVTVTRTTDGDEGDPETEPRVYTRFLFRPRWFVLSQTDGQAFAEVARPDWDHARALAALGITEVSFTHTDGNCLGFARGRAIAVNPVNPLPHKTRFHEIGHVLLGHTADSDQSETPTMSRNQKELEAECVALLCCAALDLPGTAESRGYVQSWWGQGNPIPERSAQRILKVAHEILAAGQ